MHILMIKETAGDLICREETSVMAESCKCLWSGSQLAIKVRNARKDSQRLKVLEVCMWKKRLMVLCWGWNETSCRILYFLMAATAFLAASSRSSAAKMGRPLSVRILLASWTLVPEKGQKKGRNPPPQKTVLQQATTNIRKMAKQGWTWSAICMDVKNHTVWKTKSSSGGINPHRQMESWVNGGTCNCWSERRRVWTTGKRAICVCACVCVSSPGCSEVRGSRCWAIRWCLCPQ